MYHEVVISFQSRPRTVALVEGNTPLAPATGEGSPRPDPGAARETQVQEERASVQNVLAAITNALQGLHAREQQRLAEMQQVAIELAVAIASRLTHVQIQSGEFGVDQLVREVMEQIGPKQPATLYLHPADIALLERRLETNQALLPADDNIRLAADATVSRGNCRADFGAVSICAQWQNQLPEIHQHLLRSIPDARPRPPQTQA